MEEKVGLMIREAFRAWTACALASRSKNFFPARLLPFLQLLHHLLLPHTLQLIKLSFRFPFDGSAVLPFVCCWKDGSLVRVMGAGRSKCADIGNSGTA
jgi:hypothetical protein